MAGPKIFLSAGEASGEHYGAMLISALRREAPDAEFFGLGGTRMETLGLRRVVRAEDVAVMGITEVVRHMPQIYREFRRLKASVRAERPDLAILIDFPDVNLRLAEELHQHDVPVVYFVSPQLWAWKRRRIRRVRRFVTRMLVIFPFEQAYYWERGVRAEFVGHPLADLDLPTCTRADFARENGLEPSKAWIGLLPGSRKKELLANLPEMLAAAAELGHGYEYLLPVAPTLQTPEVKTILDQLKGPASPYRDAFVHLVQDARAALLHSRASVVASGTATVEAALIGNPFVVVYRVSPVTYAVARRVVKVPHVAMVNLIAGHRVVPELIQDEFTATEVTAALRPLLREGPERAAMQAELAQVASTLRVLDLSEDGGGQRTAIDRVAGISLQLIQNRPNDRVHHGPNLATTAKPSAATPVATHVP